jgi:hypothetical protein
LDRQQWLHQHQYWHLLNNNNNNLLQRHLNLLGIPVPVDHHPRALRTLHQLRLQLGLDPTLVSLLHQHRANQTHLELLRLEPSRLRIAQLQETSDSVPKSTTRIYIPELCNLVGTNSRKDVLEQELQLKSSHKSEKNVFGITFSANLQKFIIIFYGLLKMSQGQSLPDPDLELINVRSLNFAKQKLFFKNIGRYTTTSTYIHVKIPFNFTQILDTKNIIEENYKKLLDKHEEPFKLIAKTTTDVSLMTISASIEDFQDIIKALPQTTEITSPGRPKRFIAIYIAVMAMAMSLFNAYRITELNSEISALKSKTDLLVDVSHLHEAHSHHLEEKTDATNKLLGDMLETNICLTAKLTGAIEKKFQSVVHHHKIMFKLAQHHKLAPGALPHNVLDKILNHTLTVAKN